MGARRLSGQAVEQTAENIPALSEELIKQIAETKPVIVTEPLAHPHPAAEEIDALSIFQRMDRALAEITDLKLTKSKMVWLRPPGTNHLKDEGKGYAIVPISDILEVVRRIHGRWGIKTEVGKVKIIKETTDGSKTHIIGTCKCRLIGRDAADVYTTTVNVEAQDNGDKLYNKLRTNALRNLYRTVYSLDGDEAQDPEETNTPAPSPAPKKDPFFSKPVKGTPIKVPEKKAADTRAETAQESHKEAMTDRDPAVMLETIVKANRRTSTRGIIRQYAETAGDDPSAWPLDILKEAYAEVCDAMREVGE